MRHRSWVKIGVSAAAVVWAVCLGVVAMPGSVCPGESPSHHLVVLHTNDTHGHPVKFFKHPMPDVGGLPARAVLVERIRKAHPYVLLLDAGDVNTGRPESTYFDARPDIEGYNYMGYDAVAVGNHEFDNGVEMLRTRMAWANFPFLSANVKTRAGRYLAKPYIIKDFGRFKAAVFGLTTTDTRYATTPSHVAGLVFEDEVDTARRLVPLLRKEADVVIALVHMGIYPTSSRGSRRLASEVSGIDLIVDGHSHTLLSSPVRVRHTTTGRTTPIVQAWKWGLVLGRTDLWIRDRHVSECRFEALPINLKKVVKKPGRPTRYLPVGEAIEEDPRLAALLKPYVDRMERALSRVVGRAEETFHLEGMRQGETALGDLVADSMAWLTGYAGVDFALQNAGGIRAALPGGPITMKTVHELLPFDNTVVVLTMKGARVAALFERMASRPGGGGFLQVSKGVRLTLDRARGRSEGIVIGGAPLDPGRIYRVATNSFLASAGDGYVEFLNADDTYDTSVFQRDALIRYVEHLGGSIAPRTEGRIEVATERPKALP